MGTDAAHEAELRTIIDVALRGRLDDESARRFLALGNDATLALMLAVNARMAELGALDTPGPHAPSGSIPPYAKASATRRRGKPGARDSHEGRRRPTPKPDERVGVAELATCPNCDGEVHRATCRRTRTIEDMPADARVTATEYSIPGHWCPACRKHVEPRIGAALTAYAATGKLPPMPSGAGDG